METYASLRNLKFLLHEVLNFSQLQQYERFADYDDEAADMALDAARQIADTYLYPFYREMDKDKAYYAEGTVHTHPALKEGIKALADGGWIAAIDDYDAGGQQMPATLLHAGLFQFYAANANLAAYAFLTQAAANLIRTFGDEKLHEAFVPDMYSGAWQGTMALTEPQAGSSLSDITTSAELTDEGHYLIRGQKIYISGGDHTAVDNVVHLLLARIKGAPAGTRGISLFVVPKFRLEDGELVDNDVTTAGIFGKMGQKGYVAAHLMLGEQREDCHGYLVGSPHQGLKFMFQMMNEARIGTGLVAAGTASAAYYAALKYAKERPQGRHPSNKDVNQEQVLIIEHADVKRMLLFQKAVVEGSLALLLQCSKLSDIAHVAEGEEKENAHLLLELLTPIAKSYPSEMGTLAVSTGMQCLGGAGYTDDFPLEQYYRDIRVNAIYEGTTGIHGMDLLGRKVTMAKGKAVKLLMQEIQATIEMAAKHSQLADMATQLGQVTRQLHKVTLSLLELASKEKPEVFLADATLYLEYFGTVTIAWQWLKQAAISNAALEKDLSTDEYEFYQGKVFTCRYFFEYELPKTSGLAYRLSSEDRLTLEIEESFIN
ncbi:acyl-CoA dehydrogenase [Flavilitoribacter nigricans]|uniref:Acyl-CoA dehydrogenase n=1 Tax=Flavilitoribacter nigricans (strain ATCC 23147 / DSM 23189 / NBRC 102662 / NCIMB 1420 / SS-2) TaxID=1122177 RepID=A0A2D0NIM6_FLAN2|nr:acyl-CoA dehydrogenase [Flavilitoribacter nigricans]PHN08354.1 acyl-CoA dehydrogenase [Flavilitoribacter nigricans DSM 23189 = NBRC 102662]